MVEDNSLTHWGASTNAAARHATPAPALIQGLCGVRRVLGRDDYAES
jgi:hypothetical protein